MDISKYLHTVCCVLFCYGYIMGILWIQGIDLSILLRVASLEQSYDLHSAVEMLSTDMCKTDQYLTTMKHNRVQTVWLFRGTYFE